MKVGSYVFVSSSLGLKAFIAPRFQQLASIVAAVESGMLKIEPEAANDVRRRIATALVRTRLPTVNLFPHERGALEDLKKANNVHYQLTKGMLRCSWIEPTTTR